MIAETETEGRLTPFTLRKRLPKLHDAERKRKFATSDKSHGIHAPLTSAEEVRARD